jgi:hypothetical protein
MIHNVLSSIGPSVVGLFDPGTIMVLAIGSIFVLSLAYIAAQRSIKKEVQKTIRRLQGK